MFIVDLIGTGKVDEIRVREIGEISGIQGFDHEINVFF